MISPIKIFLTIFSPIFFALIILYFSVVDITSNISYKETNRYLEDTYMLVSSLIKEGGLDESERILDNISKTTLIRVTVIDKAGKVIYDSNIAETVLSHLDNHALREEIRNATLTKGYSSVRKSVSTGINTIYFAKKIDDNVTLRLAYNADMIDKISGDNFNNIITVFIFVAIILFIIFIIIAKQISSPIKQLDNIYKQIHENKDVSDIPEFKDKTLNNVATLIYQTNSVLKKQNMFFDIEKSKLEAIISMMFEGIILVDNSGKVLRFNESAKKMLGFDLKVGQNIFLDINDIKLITFFADIKSLDDENVSQVNFGDRVFNKYVKHTGSEILIVFTDVTEVANYSDYKNALLSNITHELKTPLSLIIGASETIINDDEMKTEYRKRFLEQINKHAVRLNNIINDSVELFRLESEGKFHHIDKKTDINEVVNEINMINDSSKNKRELIFKTDIDNVGVRFTDIFSILINLIDNAKKYSNGDKVYITIARQNNGKVSIRVEDTDGPIIQPDERERIFERFYTVSKSREKSRSGTGLGLAIVKHIVQQYFGKILLYENSFNGNTFEIIIKEKSVAKIS